MDIDFPLKCDDGSLPEDSTLRRWSNLLMESAAKNGSHLDTCGQAAQMMHNAGFVDIVRIPFKWPIGMWARGDENKKIGYVAAYNFQLGAESIPMALFTRVLGWNREQVVEFAKDLVDDLWNLKYHTYFDLYVTFARKP